MLEAFALLQSKGCQLVSWLYPKTYTHQLLKYVFRNSFCVWADIIWEDSYHDGRWKVQRSHPESYWGNFWLYWKGILCLTCQPFTEFLKKCCDPIGSSPMWLAFIFFSNNWGNLVLCVVVKIIPFSWSNYVLIISFLGDALTERYKLSYFWSIKLQLQ